MAASSTATIPATMMPTTITIELDPSMTITYGKLLLNVLELLVVGGGGFGGFPETCVVTCGLIGTVVILGCVVVAPGCFCVVCGVDT